LKSPSAQVALVLPFRFLLSFPVELILGKPTHGNALLLLAAQWGYLLFFFAVLSAVWRAGLRRYAAYGG